MIHCLALRLDLIRSDGDAPNKKVFIPIESISVALEDWSVFLLHKDGSKSTHKPLVIGYTSDHLFGVLMDLPTDADECEITYSSACVVPKIGLEIRVDVIDIDNTGQELPPPPEEVDKEVKDRLQSFMALKNKKFFG